MNPKRFFFVLLGVITITVLAGGAGYYLAIGRIATSSADIRAKLAEQRQNEDTLTSLSVAKAQYKRAIEPLLPTLMAVLPQTKNQTEILIQLQTLAKSSGLYIGSISFPAAAGLPSQTSQTTKAGLALALPISFQISGTYDQLQSFLQSVETLGRLTVVTNLNISHPDLTNLNLLNYAITVNTFVKP